MKERITNARSYDFVNTLLRELKCNLSAKDRISAIFTENNGGIPADIVQKNRTLSVADHQPSVTY